MNVTPDRLALILNEVHQEYKDLHKSKLDLSSQRKPGEFMAVEYAEFSQVEHRTANIRLNKLYHAGKVSRRRVGTTYFWKMQQT